MSYRLSDEHDYPRMTPAVQWIIAINVAVIFLQFTIVSPADIFALLGFKSSTIPGSWWTILTYMFVHGGLVHLLVNMYMLWVFGCRLEHAWGTGAFTRFFLWCGVGGLVGHLLVGGGGVLIGASGAVMGVMLGYALSWPEDEVMFFGVIPMKVKWLIPLFVAINLSFGLVNLGSHGGIAYFAHLGGLAFGWLYMRTPTAGGLEKIRHRVSPVQDETDEPPRAVPRSLPRNRERMSEIDEIVAKSNAVASRRQNAVLPPRKSEIQKGNSEALDLVLDKISERGLDSLTAAERKLLEDMSRQLRSGE